LLGAAPVLSVIQPLYPPAARPLLAAAHPLALRAPAEQTAER